VVESALEGMEDGVARMLTFGVSDDEAWDVGLTCGGKISVFVEPLDTTWWSKVSPHVRQHRPEVFDIGASEHGPHAGQGGRLSGVYGRNLCVRVDAAHKAHDDHAWQDDIRQVLPVPD